MSYQEKNIVVSLFTTVVVYAIFYFYLHGMVEAGRFEGADSTALLGKAILVLIAGSIVLTIISTIIFNILYAIAANDPKPSFVVDERDKLIELRGLQITLYITGGGFVLAMALLALAYTPFLAFNVIIAAFATGDFTGNLCRLVIYRRGF